MTLHIANTHTHKSAITQSRTHKHQISRVQYVLCFPLLKSHCFFELFDRLCNKITTVRQSLIRDATKGMHLVSFKCVIKVFRNLQFNKWWIVILFQFVLKKNYMKTSMEIMKCFHINTSTFGFCTPILWNLQTEICKVQLIEPVVSSLCGSLREWSVLEPLVDCILHTLTS